MREIHLVKAVVIFLIGAAKAIALYLKKRKSEAWPMVGGRIETAYTMGEYGTIAELGYSYSSNGEYYSGLYQRQFRSDNSAEKFLEVARGQEVMVRYEPEHPDNSIIREQDNPLLTTSV